MSINHLFMMGGYGLYVWPAYGITLAVLGINLLASVHEKFHVKKQLNIFLSDLNEPQTKK